jgi:Uma2 family endonuclease
MRAGLMFPMSHAGGILRPAGGHVPVEFVRRRFDVDEYHRMGQAGILSPADRVELIDGEIVTMTPIGARHNAAVNRANRALGRAAGDQAIVQVQGSIRLGRLDEPQPDLAFLRPKADFYAAGLPGPADVLLVIEIADASLAYDREVKSRLYAAVGIPEYWLVNLDARIVTRFLRPEGGTYRDVRQIPAGQTLAPQLLPSCEVPAEWLMDPAPEAGS